MQTTRGKDHRGRSRSRHTTRGKGTHRKRHAYGKYKHPNHPSRHESNTYLKGARKTSKAPAQQPALLTAVGELSIQSRTLLVRINGIKRIQVVHQNKTEEKINAPPGKNRSRFRKRKRSAAKQNRTEDAPSVKIDTKNDHIDECEKTKSIRGDATAKR